MEPARVRRRLRRAVSRAGRRRDRRRRRCRGVPGARLAGQRRGRPRAERRGPRRGDRRASSASSASAGERPAMAVAPLADPSLTKLLEARRLGRRARSRTCSCATLDPAEEFAPAPAGVEVRLAAQRRRARAVGGPGRQRLLGARGPVGGRAAAGPGRRRRARRAPASSATSTAQPAGTGELHVRDGIGWLTADTTLPQFRRRGVQGAIQRARLELARDAGCDLALTEALPGSASQRNMERLGFRIVYTRVEALAPEVPVERTHVMATPSETTIAFIGTGVMGLSMAGHLLDAGYPLVVFNRTAAKAEPLLERGARWADIGGRSRGRRRRRHHDGRLPGRRRGGLPGAGRHRRARARRRGARRHDDVLARARRAGRQGRGRAGDRRARRAGLRRRHRCEERDAHDHGAVATPRRSPASSRCWA